MQSLNAMAPQQIAALAQQQQLQNLTQQLQSQLSLQNMNLSFFNQVICGVCAIPCSLPWFKAMDGSMLLFVLSYRSVCLSVTLHALGSHSADASCRLRAGHRPCGAWPASPAGTCPAKAAARICRVAA